MKNVSKTAIIPVVTVLAAAYTLITKEAVKQDTIDMIASVAVIIVGAGVNIWGIIKNHKK